MIKRNILIYVAVAAILVLLFIGLPWYYAYQGYSSVSGCLGLEKGKQIFFYYVDKTHFEAYKTALWYDDSLTISGLDGMIFCNGTRIEYPPGKNVALVRSAEDVSFVQLSDSYFQEDLGQSEVFYILGKVPHFKKKRKGMIDLQKVKDDHIIQKEWEAFLDMTPSKKTGRQVSPERADKLRGNKVLE
jgi:hypothetical protein